MANMVDLGPKLEAFVRKQVKAGRFKSRSALIREGLKLMQVRDAAAASKRRKRNSAD